MKIEYTVQGDYMIPMIQMPEMQQVTIGRFGQMRKDYLRKEKRLLFYSLLTDCRLDQHLVEINREAEEMLTVLIAKMKKTEGLTEKMKEENMMLWVAKMNNIKARAMEIVISEIIFS